MVQTKHSLLEEYIKKLISKPQLSDREVIDLLRYYKNDGFQFLKYTNRDIEKFILHNGKRVYYELEKARRHFKNKFKMWAIRNTDNTNPSVLKENEIIYSKQHIPYVAENGEYKRVTYFD